MVKRKRVRYEIQYRQEMTDFEDEQYKDFCDVDPLRLDTRNEEKARKDFDEWLEYNAADIKRGKIEVGGLFRVKPGRTMKIAP